MVSKKRSIRYTTIHFSSIDVPKIDARRQGKCVVRSDSFWFVFLSIGVEAEMKFDREIYYVNEMEQLSVDMYSVECTCQLMLQISHQLTATTFFAHSINCNVVRPTLQFQTS